MKITINEVEMMTVNLLANLRGIGARIAGVKDGKVSDKNNSEIDFEGLLGEYAFCKHYNLFFDLTPTPRSGSYDCIHNGKRIDIKATKHLNGHLLGKMERNFDVDIFVLAIIEFGRSNVVVHFPGWIEAEALYSPTNLGDINGSPVYKVAQGALKSLV